MFFFERKGAKSRTAIGILGCGPGAGVTHLSIALCSYCASKLKRRTAYLELHPRDEIAQLIPKHSLPDSIDPEARPHFGLHGADYFPRVAANEIPLLLNRGYEDLILDMGSLGEAALPEFLRCDRKLVLGSLSPWKQRDYEGFFGQIGNSVNLGEGFFYLVQTGVLKDIPEFSRNHHVSMQSVPFIDDPFRIRKEHFEFLANLMSSP